MIDGMPVMDAVIHAYNVDPSNYANKYARPLAEMVLGSVNALMPPSYVPSADSYYRDWTMEETVQQVFVESMTDLAVNHVLPIYSFKDGLCSLEKAIECKERWPNRIINYCGVDPMMGRAALDELDRQIELLDPVGLKLYPNSWVGDELNGWKMDDPEIAFPLFERARDRGLKVVAIHKALPLGPMPMEYLKMDDIDRAALAFPDLNFEVVHGGMAFLEETAWQLARFPNVYVNLEVTSALVVQRPDAFLHAMAALTGPGGAFVLDRLLWGTGSMVFHPQPLLEAFVRDFKIPEAMVERSGIPQFTQDVKRAILFDNYGKMIGEDLTKRLEATKDDEFAVRTRDGIAPPFSTANQ